MFYFYHRKKERIMGKYTNKQRTEKRENEIADIEKKEEKEKTTYIHICDKRFSRLFNSDQISSGKFSLTFSSKYFRIDAHS